MTGTVEYWGDEREAQFEDETALWLADHPEVAKRMAELHGQQVQPSSTFRLLPTLEQVAAHGRYEPDDVTVDLKEAARKYLAEYDGSFEFLVDIKDRVVNRHKEFTVGMTKGVLNCMVAEAKRNRRPTQAEVASEPVREGGGIARFSQAVALEDGIYLTPEGTVYKVQHAVHGSGRQYAKRLVLDEAAREEERKPRDRFEYEAGAVYRLKAEWQMTLEQARQFGALYGTCCNCGRTLTNEDSIEAGIGPICRTKFAA